MSTISSVAVSEEAVSGGETLEFYEPLRLPRTRIPYSGYGGQGLQVFTPRKILSFSAGQSLGTAQDEFNPETFAIRAAVTTTYQINGTGELGTLFPGVCLGIAQNVTSIKFPDGATIEVM